jgi:hypothetical protein
LAVKEFPKKKKNTLFKRSMKRGEKKTGVFFKGENQEAIG